MSHAIDELYEPVVRDVTSDTLSPFLTPLSSTLHPDYPPCRPTMNTRALVPMNRYVYVSNVKECV
jgi:hypothetical protein